MVDQICLGFAYSIFGSVVACYRHGKRKDLVDWVHNHSRRLNHNHTIFGNWKSISRNKVYFTFWFFSRYNYFPHAIWKIATSVSSWVNLDVVFNVTYIIFEKEEIPIPTLCLSKEIDLFSMAHTYSYINRHIVIYTPYLSLTIWHDLLTSIIYWISRPEKWINIQHNNIKCKRNRNSLFRKTVTPLTFMYTICLFFMFFSFKMRIKIIGFP